MLLLYWFDLVGLLRIRGVDADGLKFKLLFKFVRGLGYNGRCFMVELELEYFFFCVGEDCCGRVELKGQPIVDLG